MVYIVVRFFLNGGLRILFNQEAATPERTAQRAPTMCSQGDTETKMVLIKTVARVLTCWVFVCLVGCASFSMRLTEEDCLSLQEKVRTTQNPKALRASASLLLMYDAEKYTPFVSEQLRHRRNDEVVELIITLGTFGGEHAIPFLEDCVDSTTSFSISTGFEGDGQYDSSRSIVCVGDLASRAIEAIKAQPNPGHGRQFETWSLVKVE